MMKTEATNSLINILENGLDVHRCAAARALGVVSGPNAVAALIKALQDEDPDVRVDAAEALVEIGDSEAAEKLMENLLGDPDSDVKKAAISGLVAMQHEPVVPLLRALTVDRAEDQITWDEEEFFQDGWDSWLDIQIAAIRGLSEFAPEAAVGDILKALMDEMGQDVTEPAFQALANMDQAGANALTTIYSAGEPRFSRRIARAVGNSNNPHLDELRQALLADASAKIRALALKNLAANDQRLGPMFEDDEPEVRSAAVRHAGSEHPEILRGLIADASAEVRAEVFKQIAKNPRQFNNKEDAEAVKKALKGDPVAAKNAALALFALKGPNVATGFAHVFSKPDVPLEFRIGVLETLEKAGQVAVPTLLDVAADPDRQLRLASLTTLASIAANDPTWPNDAGEGLLLALKGELIAAPTEEEIASESEPDAELMQIDEKAIEPEELDAINREIDESLPLVAEDAAPGSTLRSIMENTPQEPVADVSEPVLDQEQERFLEMSKVRKFSKKKVSWDTEVAPYLDVRRFSARLLGQVLKPDVTEALVAALGDDIDDETRDGVLFSLAKHGEEMGGLPGDLLEKMQEYLDSDNSETRVLAARIIGTLPVAMISDHLLVLAGHQDPLVRVEAVKALGRLNVGQRVLLNALDDEYLGVGIAAARCLAQGADDEAVHALVEYACNNDGTYRRDIGKLLGLHAPLKGEKMLLELLKNGDRKAHWLVAIDALAELFQQPEPDRTLLVA